ncbi:hypothetical protein GF323_06100 [Candidatus Woesearchaeota archaeon]|nr:hypothetical protein [Candidatus Woesearchaeota archaeon]
MKEDFSNTSNREAGHENSQAEIPEKPKQPDEFHEEPKEVIRPKKRQTVKVLAVAFAAILVVSVLTQLYNPTFTGHVIVKTDKVEVQDMAYKGSTYLISSNRSIPMKSAKLTGTIMGNGSVSVYLANGAEKKLIYTNKAMEKKFPLITGFAVKSIKEQKEGSFVEIDFENIRLEKEGRAVSGIRLISRGNDQGKYIEKVSVSWQPDNGEKITGIMLNDAEFWGYGSAGSPIGKQVSGRELSAWGQKLPDEEAREINEILFDSDMTGKEITIELFFYDYLVSFRLGQERKAKIFIDLSGEKESYVEEDGEKKQIYDISRIRYSKNIGETGGTSEGSSGSEEDAGEAGSSEQFTETRGINGTKTAASAINNAFADIGNYTAKYLIANLPDGRIIKKKLLKDEINFVDTNNTAIQLQVIEDPKYREAFEKTAVRQIYNISHECEETCVLDRLEREEYEFVFEIEEGTAMNVTSIAFS